MMSKQTTKRLAVYARPTAPTSPKPATSQPRLESHQSPPLAEASAPASSPRPPKSQVKKSQSYEKLIYEEVSYPVCFLHCEP